MISYEVTAEVEERLAADFERYMRETHIPEVLGTGCFREATFARTSRGRYRTAYVAATQADLDRYLGTHTPALRQVFAQRFPDGIRLSRDVWAEVERWDAGPLPGIH